MEPIDIGIAVSIGLLVLVVLGMRVAFAAAMAGLIGLIWIFWAKKGYDPSEFTWALTVATKTAGQVPHSKVASQALSLIPTFILIGYLAYYAGLTKALFEAAKRWIAWVPGGLAVATVFATAGFAAVSGASVATSAVFARIAIPEMLENGYNKQFAAGVVAAAGTLASLIPPSAILVIYAIIVEQDVGKLLLAGFIPGAFSALVYTTMIITIAVIWKNVGPPIGGFTWKQRFQSLPPALPIVAVVVIIIFFVYNPFGDAWGTPTEGGAIGAFIIFLMALYRGMRWAELKSALLDTAKLTVMIFSIIWGVLIYVRFLGFAELPSAFADWITSLEMAPILILICILLAYAVLGMFMDAIGMLLLTLPVVYPAVMALNGGDNVAAADSAFGMSGPMCAIWFGILVVKMAEFCLITPPIGLNCFVVAGVRDDLTVQDVFKGVMPFFVADAITIALLVAFPAIVLWLPSLAS
jgi:tripartite ATP-independent transporter DctM subunit